MRIASIARTVGSLVALGSAAVAAYVIAVRPRILRWGATDTEVEERLPGDELVLGAKEEATRAITIEAPVESVWPWLVQMGLGRGGLYSYDFLENMIGVEMRSADRIIPELQDLKVGDVVRIMPGEGGFEVVTVEPERALVLYSGVVDARTLRQVGPDEPRPESCFSYSWAFVLDKVSEGTTRLIVRSRLDYHPESLGNVVIWRGLTEPASFVMERGMLQGIKERAEALARQRGGNEGQTGDDRQPGSME